ncbi:MAG TPA: phosphotransferase [Acidimicrobiia bacterium]|jgi:hypothetical protein
MSQTSDPEPGELLAHGRGSDVYALDGHRVLRRYRGTSFAQREARLMEYVRAHGYPIPAVHEVRPDALVLDRVHGPTMADAIVRRPWTFRASMRMLAELHDRLHAIPAPDWLDLAPAGEGACVVHLDLHPLNVLIGPEGPVVIDWTNAGRGRADVDIALTWLLLQTGAPDDNRAMQLIAASVRKLTTGWFSRAADPSGAAVRDGLQPAVRYRLENPTLHERERRAVSRLLDRA